MFLLAMAATLSLSPVNASPPLDAAADAASWQKAASVQLKWNLQGHKPATDPTTAYIESDGKYVYVRFDAKQTVGIVATQHTDDAGQGSDDDVTVDLWPGGTNGFLYEFTANPIGTHYQSSSENTGFRPAWTSSGRIHDGGYTVVMRIPLSVLHGAASKTWLVQFSRRVQMTGDIDVWAYDPNETDPATSIYAGKMVGITAGTAARPKPRVELYNLASAAGASIGGSTARTGADISIPFTATSSFYATLHPDYSNVELDQQTISPTAYRRQFSEVRPFFTQGRAAYNNFDCDMCQGIITLYTPAIPTPRRGYAIEGKEGAITYGAFDAVGNARTDAAQAVSWRSADHKLGFTAQRVGVNLPGFADTAVELGSTFSDQKHLFGYFNYGSDKGTNVADGSHAQYYDLGGGWFSPVTAFGFAVRKEGRYFNPTDGFVWHPDTAGYGAFFSHAWLYGNGAAIRSITITNALARYHDRTGELNDTTQGVGVDILTRGLIDVSLGTGSNYVRFTPQGPFYPVTQNGVTLTFGSGAENSSVNNGAQHGQSATPTSIGFSTGRFGPGRLNSMTFSTTQRAGRRALVSLAIDENAQFLDSGAQLRQWFQRLSYTYQADKDSSFALGVRRIMGEQPVIDGAPTVAQGWNLSAAYHRTFAGANEIYAVYGDASAFSTAPQFIVKWIHYFGGAKGT